MKTEDKKSKATRMPMEAPLKLVESCPCQTFPKGTKWDETQWEKHWANQKQNYMKRLEQLHLESRGTRQK